MYDEKDFTKTIPGDVGFTLTHGPGRWTIPWMMALMGDGCVFEHVALAVGRDTLFEAMPPKARMRTVHPSDDMLWFRLPLTNSQRYAISRQTWDDYIAGDIKYGWGSYLNIALLKWGIRPNFVKESVENGRRKMCSQLADKYLTDVGVNVLDGVLPGEVTPGDLEFRLAHDPTVIPFRLNGDFSWKRPSR